MPIANRVADEFFCEDLEIEFDLERMRNTDGRVEFEIEYDENDLREARERIERLNDRIIARGRPYRETPEEIDERLRNVHIRNEARRAIERRRREDEEFEMIERQRLERIERKKIENEEKMRMKSFEKRLLHKNFDEFNEEYLAFCLNYFYDYAIYRQPRPIDERLQTAYDEFLNNINFAVHNLEEYRREKLERNNYRINNCNDILIGEIEYMYDL